MNRKGRLQFVWLNKGRATEPQFEVSFISYQSAGGPAPSRKFTGEESLLAFLIDEVRADSGAVAAALDELIQSGSGGLEAITLSDEELAKLKLV